MRILNKEQFEKIAGQEYAKDSFFNPVLDADGDRVISEEEVDQCTVEKYMWVKELPQKDFKPIIVKHF